MTTVSWTNAEVVSSVQQTTSFASSSSLFTSCTFYGGLCYLFMEHNYCLPSAAGSVHKDSSRKPHTHDRKSGSGAGDCVIIKVPLLVRRVLRNCSSSSFSSRNTRSCSASYYSNVNNRIHEHEFFPTPIPILLHRPLRWRPHVPSFRSKTWRHQTTPLF